MDDPHECVASASDTSAVLGPEQALEKIVVKSALATMGTPEYFTRFDALAPDKRGQRKVMMGDDPALSKMPAAPTLLDFFKLRFDPAAASHLLQSANLALRAGVEEKGVLACLLHDIAMVGLIGGDHGYWGAQLIAPYVDEEVAFAVRYHQALRFFPDPAAGYEYPQAYIDIFGKDYKPEPYIRADYEYARKHKWYGMARMITLNDLYAFDPNTTVDLETFTDIVGRHFRQPKEGLGFDNSSVAHMWRTMIWPRNFL
ncbi:HD domain-containing protein [Methylocapsa sp. D3K7]|uniref:HD domain-containing protein n=1 Tax=Methylocapsa sp. D3K7 TaxID=3041435 RepID=UPI00244EF26F|nr:HD domain-containing protein [Methylocapsa sp. D3K7]WGJ15483.1 HD domain-containing protein [Methylocapsa sp. D3K7]